MELEPSRTALIPVHLQGDVVTREGAFGPFFAEMVERTGVLGKAAELIGTGREAGATIAYVRIVFGAGQPELDVTAPIWGMVKEAGCMVDGTPGATIVAAVAPRPGDDVVDHHRIDPTFESDLEPRLRDAGIDTVVVFGVATNVSVEAVARALADRRFRVIVVEDACTAGDEDAHRASIATLQLLASEVADTAAVEAALRSGVAA